MFGAGATGGQAYTRLWNPWDFWLSIKAEFPGRTVYACQTIHYSTSLPRTCFAALCRQCSPLAQPLVWTDNGLKIDEWLLLTAVVKNDKRDAALGIDTQSGKVCGSPELCLSLT